MLRPTASTRSTFSCSQAMLRVQELDETKCPVDICSWYGKPCATDLDQFFILDTHEILSRRPVAALQGGRCWDQGHYGVLPCMIWATPLRSKGLPFPEQCRIFRGSCNPPAADRGCSSPTDWPLNMLLPLQGISSTPKPAKTRIGMIRPEAMLASLFSPPIPPFGRG